MTSAMQPYAAAAPYASADTMLLDPLRRSSATQPVKTAHRRVVLVQADDPSSALVERFRANGYTTVDTVPTLPQALAIVERTEVSLVIFPMSGETQVPISVVQAMRRYPQAQCIATAPQKDADVVLSAMRCGISEFLVSPIDPEELERALRRLEDQARPMARAQNQLIMVYGARGGIGVSTIATSLAWLLSDRQSGEAPGGSRSALLEFSTSGDGVRALLNVDPPHDLSHLAWRPDQWDRELVESVTYTHPERVALLLGARDPAQATPLDAVAANRLLALMRASYGFVVVDTDHHITGQTLAALEMADRVVLVTQRELGALRSTKRMLDLFTRLGVTSERIQLVVNRVSPRDRLTRGDVVTVLGHPVNAELPNDYALCERALTAGTFVPLNGRATPLAQALQRLAVSVTGVDLTADAPPRRSRLTSFWPRQ